jgi:hypothetical protein
MFKVTNTLCVPLFPKWLWGIIVFSICFLTLGIIGALMRAAVFMVQRRKPRAEQQSSEPLLQEKRHNSK